MSIKEKICIKKLILPKISFSNKKIKSTALLTEDFTNHLFTRNQKCSNLMEKTQINKTLKFSNLYLDLKIGNNNLSPWVQNNSEKFTPFYFTKQTSNKNNNIIAETEKKQKDFLNTSREIKNSVELEEPSHKKIKINKKYIKYYETTNNNKTNKKNIESIRKKFIIHQSMKKSKPLKKFLETRHFNSSNHNSFNMTKKLNQGNRVLANMIVSGEKINKNINFECKIFKRNAEYNSKSMKNTYSINNSNLKNESTFFLSTQETKNNSSSIKNSCKAALVKKESRNIFINISKYNRDLKKEEDKDINIISNGRFNNNK